ncbi:E3 ubiquitin-protein ligase NRDP1-like [Anneissia japonica]|uniref:E3 ubiquitin-protein ligase NRDP1-like n=1 Tax=Anneissia japonica TaxID=1529436 RepID=UPI0014258C1F|nr:E3 ubiquitin-protein ligase NRDP1-like [Anneissia japonica]
MACKKRKREAIDEQDDEEERYFLNPESVSRHLFCSICQEVFIKPQRAPCGHSYCKKCITSWLKHKKTCPEDRVPLQPLQLHNDFILANIIGDQMVACPFRKAGCDFIGQLQKLASHKKSCDFNPVNLPEFMFKGTTSNQVLTPGPNKDGNSILGDGESLPTPAKPSLKMRLFHNGGGQRDLLLSMFNNKENKNT